MRARGAESTAPCPTPPGCCSSCLLLCSPQALSPLFCLHGSCEQAHLCQSLILSPCCFPLCTTWEAEEWCDEARGGSQGCVTSSLLSQQTDIDLSVFLECSVGAVLGRSPAAYRQAVFQPCFEPGTSPALPCCSLEALPNPWLWFSVVTAGLALLCEGQWGGGVRKQGPGCPVQHRL